MPTYFCSLCLGLGREYFKYPSHGTILRPARVEMIFLTLKAAPFVFDMLGAPYLSTAIENTRNQVKGISCFPKTLDCMILTMQL